MGDGTAQGNIVHGACGRSWSGVSRAHCPKCHETFSSDSAAEKHRTGKHGVDRRCVDPASVGLVSRDQPWGVMWTNPAPVGGRPWGVAAGAGGTEDDDSMG